MIMVVGGIASGKRTFARSLGYADADMSDSLEGAFPVLVDAQQLVRAPESDVASVARAIAEKRDVVLAVDVGGGIVPLDAGERAWRERAGLLNRLLAEQADAVVRMTCGVAQVLKGMLPEGVHDAVLSADDRDSESEGERRDGARKPPQAGHSFFSNRACKYFPCHEGVDEDEFNCLFCYCPLYALGPACGGDFTYTETGRKNCTACSIPHRGDAGVDLVARRYDEIARIAQSS